jgi:hypothetical protein
LDGSTLIKCYNPEKDIPAGVTAIWYFAFADCKSLAAINIPGGVTATDQTGYI